MRYFIGATIRDGVNDPVTSYAKGTVEILRDVYPQRATAEAHTETTIIISSKGTRLRFRFQAVESFLVTKVFGSAQILKS